MLLLPGLNLQRDVLGGSNYELYSEDPLLSGYMAAAYINGIQSERVGASAGYFATGSGKTAKETVNVNVTERALREIYLTAFEIAVKNSAPYALISSPDKMNGVDSSASRELLSTICVRNGDTEASLCRL